MTFLIIVEKLSCQNHFFQICKKNVSTGWYCTIVLIIIFKNGSLVINAREKTFKSDLENGSPVSLSFFLTSVRVREPFHSFLPSPWSPWFDCLSLDVVTDSQSYWKDIIPSTVSPKLRKYLSQFLLFLILNLYKCIPPSLALIIWLLWKTNKENPLCPRGATCCATLWHHSLSRTIVPVRCSPPLF